LTRGGTMASDKFIAEHPDLVRAYVSAIADAADWANAHPADVIKLGLDKGRLDSKYLPDLYTKNGKTDYSGLRWARHGLNNEQDLAFWLQLVEHAGIVPAGKFMRRSDLGNQGKAPLHRAIEIAQRRAGAASSRLENEQVSLGFGEA
jgi:ABC-type nitrate/sulfonate/bicarbonate transport system substrate-binding protein